MRLATFRLRSLMVLVAVSTAPMLAFEQLQRRGRRFERLSAQHRAQAAVFGVSDLEWFLLLQTPQGAGADRWRRYYDSDADHELVDAAAHHSAFQYEASVAYEEAAKRPWTAPSLPRTAPPMPPFARTKAVIAKALERLYADAERF